MTTKPTNDELIQRATNFFRDEIVPSHLDTALTKASKLKAYKINPFTVKYLANFLEGDGSPRSIAKALLYPRILGTSVSTIFGNQAQKMISTLFEGLGSAVHGIDIEFEDFIDKRKKYCQIKSGPTTINSPDVITVKNHFKGIQNLARTNNLKIEYGDLVVGILYGEPHQLSNNYKNIKKDFPIIIGADFWHRLTGQQDFYLRLIDAIGEVAIDIDGREKLEKAISLLAKEVEAKFL
jgi:hypothetical protein